ncbi:hypothetical protein PACTADRAFT_51806 [Pachysolen tannophilus NRRL Y-2460]|uniref:Protein BOI2 n=1 Tax=Pachysolen tannophilus NRRL Y-2460 TaxID=669874 RepID=A0A1E4TN81_PACTA|nr:hypothetical protein PACTADRAFT_51806 [Pachysolen tannophilus NRRL Y-2460]
MFSSSISSNAYNNNNNNNGNGTGNGNGIVNGHSNNNGRAAGGYSPSINTSFGNSSTNSVDNIGTLYEAVKEFNARLGDELTLKVGDKIDVISDDSEYNDGWYMGKNLTTNEVGLYPKAFTQICQDHQINFNKPSLLRSRSRRLASPSQSSPLTPSANAMYRTGTNGGSSEIANSSTAHGSALTGASTGGSKQSPVNTTMKDIDKALQELAIESPQIGNTSASASISASASGTGTEVSRDVNNSMALNPAEVESWSPEQVSTYFASLGFDMESAGKFARHKITGAILLELELAYLKELDISSFGTRFEIYKEIEALKIENKNRSFAKSITGASVNSSNSLMPPPSVHRQFSKNSTDADSDLPTAPLGHTRKRSQSLDDSKIPAINYAHTQQPQQLQIPEREHNLKIPLNSGNAISPIIKIPDAIGNSHETPKEIGTPSSLRVPPLDGQFTSPRKPPAPPSHLSPTAEKLNFGYKFGGGNVHNVTGGKTDPLHQQSNRSSMFINSTSYDPRKLNPNSLNNNLNNAKNSTSRPTSSIYDHTRNSSQQSYPATRTGSPTRSHRRGISEISTTTKNPDKANHKRHSSVFSYSNSTTVGDYKSASDTRRNSLVNLFSTPSRLSVIKGNRNGNDDLNDFDDITDLSQTTIKKNRSSTNSQKRSSLSPSELKETKASPYRRSFSAKEASTTSSATFKKLPNVQEREQKRSASEALKLKSLRNTSSSGSQRLSSRNKKKTSAFQEGIRHITPEDAIRTADYSGWMSKRGNVHWKTRYFALHKTRLSYFHSLKDKSEQGLIDITSHRVLPATQNETDKLTSFYAASIGSGRYCFKLVPPAPGSRKGLTFTQQKVHYFAVDTKEEMRNWMAALIKTTIDFDETTPIVSSYVAPTVSLQKAQEMLANARQHTQQKDAELRAKRALAAAESSGNPVATHNGTAGSESQQSSNGSSTLLQSSEPTTADTTNDPDFSTLTRRNNNDDTLSSSNSSITDQQQQQQQQMKFRGGDAFRTPEIEQTSRHSSNNKNLNKLDTEIGGFSSPYLLASGLLSPKSPSESAHSEDHAMNSAGSKPSINRTRTMNTNPVPMITNLENGTTSNSSPAAIAAANGALRHSSSRRKKNIL